VPDAAGPGDGALFSVASAILLSRRPTPGITGLPFALRHRMRQRLFWILFAASVLIKCFLLALTPAARASEEDNVDHEPRGALVRAWTRGHPGVMRADRDQRAVAPPPAVARTP